MKTIYILLTRSSTFVSRVVYLTTGAPYTHVSLAFEHTLFPLYSSSRKNGRTLFPAGPCTERLAYGYYLRHRNIPCAVYKFTLEDAVYERARQEAEAILACADLYHFSILGLLLCRLNIPWHRRHHFFCSQLVSEILQRSGALQLPKDPTLMRPVDYMRLPQLTCCFRGTIGQLAQGRTPAFPQNAYAELSELSA